MLVLALGRVGSLPRAEGPHSPKGGGGGGALQAVECSVYKVHYIECYSYAYNK